MTRKSEFRKLKNDIAIKAIVKIILYSLIAFLIILFLIDFLYNDRLANLLSSINLSLYHFLAQYKSIILVLVYIIVLLIITYIVIRDTAKNMEVILEATDKILKRPEQEIKLPATLLLVENRLNEIRIDLIKEKNRAKEAEQKKNDLIVYMAHDLKTPLTSIIGYLTLLKDEKEISKELQERYIKIAYDKALRVEDLTNQFFDITRYNLQDMPINKQNIDLSYLLRQLVDECYPMLDEKNLVCNLEAPDKLMFLGDGDKLARAFGNLLKNAINYSYENSEINIILKNMQDKISVVFINKGDKIPEYKLEKIFDKFYRADDSRASSTGGAGLGLAITKKIIELHGGNIHVENKDEYIKFFVEL